ncbi:hypothetical protein LG299_08925 [Microbacterium lacus]|uniref:hypothetical protein n=1 Tax=Microbacterium lacus TaxID=415217 RepID=UPI0038511DC6
MDAEAEAELEALRRRTYGPDADIDTDPEALERLTALEDEALRARAEQAIVEAPPDVTSEPTGARAGVPMPETVPAPAVVTSDPVGRSRPRAHTALVGVVGVAALILGTLGGMNAGIASLGTSAPVPTATSPPAVSLMDPVLEAEIADVLEFALDAEVLMTLGLDGAFGTYVDVPQDTEIPGFPIPEPRWMSSLGEYFGFDLWIGGSIRLGEAIEPGPQTLCLVLMQPATNRSRCMEREAWDSGAMLLAVPYAELDEAERPPHMTADQSLGFWWTSEGKLRVMLGRLD